MEDKEVFENHHSIFEALCLIGSSVRKYPEAWKLAEKVMEHQKKPSHDIHHISRVYLQALYIFQCEKVIKDAFSESDLEVLEDYVALGAIFHDVTDKKLSGNYSNEMKSVLETIFPNDNHKIEDILWIVSNVSWSKEKARSKEENEFLFNIKNGLKHAALCIVSDADRLDAIGAVGLARCFSYGGEINRPIFSNNKDVNLSCL